MGYISDCHKYDILGRRFLKSLKSIEIPYFWVNMRYIPCMRAYPDIWRFPEIGVPLFIIHFHGMSPNKNHPAMPMWYHHRDPWIPRKKSRRTSPLVTLRPHCPGGVNKSNATHLDFHGHICLNVDILVQSCIYIIYIYIYSHT